MRKEEFEQEEQSIEDVEQVFFHQELRKAGRIWHLS
jgi:hypothetical protein